MIRNIMQELIKKVILYDIFAYSVVLQKYQYFLFQITFPHFSWLCPYIHILQSKRI